MNFDLNLKPYAKSNMIVELHVKHKTIKLLEKKIEENI